MTAIRQWPTFSECQVRPLRLGVVLDSAVVPKWINRILSSLDHSADAELTLLIIIGGESNGSSWTVDFARLKHMMFSLYRGLDAHLFLRRSMRPDAFCPTHFVPQNGRTALLNCLPSVNGQSFVLPPEEIECIRSFHLDLILHFSERLPVVMTHDWARHGVWSFDGSKELANFLFWSLFRDNRVLENGLNVVTSNGQNGRLPGSYFAGDSLSLFRNHSNSCWERSQTVGRRLAELQHEGWESIEKSLVVLPPLQHFTPSNLDTARLLLRLLTRAARQQVIKHCLREEWFIAFCRVRPSEALEGDRSSLTVLRPPRDHFYADPFVVEINGRTYIFFEDYSFEHGKGVISFVEVDAEKGCTQAEPVLDEKYHLSYPCIFQWQGEIYLLPETKNNKTVQLYRATSFPKKWQLAKVLIADVAAVDPTLLYHGGRFWLFASGLDHADPWFEARNELSLFYSDSLWGPWIPHPRNPVVSDVHRSRPAGQLFLHGGQLIRPAQDCSIDYGYAVSLNRVDVLSRTDYRETPIGYIRPDWIANNRGTHTFNRSSAYEVLDGRTLIGRFARSSTRARLETLNICRRLITYT